MKTYIILIIDDEERIIAATTVTSLKALKKILLEKTLLSPECFFSSITALTKSY